MVLACATTPSSPAETPIITPGQATRIPQSLDTSATPKYYDTALYNGPEDLRLQLMGRVVAVIVGDKSLAVPFSVLRKEPAVHYRLNGQDLVVFYQAGTASSIDNSSSLRVVTWAQPEYSTRTWKERN